MHGYVGLCVMRKHMTESKLSFIYHCTINCCGKKLFSQYSSSRKSPITVHCKPTGDVCRQVVHTEF